MEEEIGQIANTRFFLATDSPEEERSGARSGATSLKGVHQIGASPPHSRSRNDASVLQKFPFPARPGQSSGRPPWKHKGNVRPAPRPQP